MSPSAGAWHVAGVGRFLFGMLVGWLTLELPALLLLGLAQSGDWDDRVALGVQTLVAAGTLALAYIAYRDIRDRSRAQERDRIDRLVADLVSLREASLLVGFVVAGRDVAQLRSDRQAIAMAAFIRVDRRLDPDEREQFRHAVNQLVETQNPTTIVEADDRLSRLIHNALDRRAC